MDWNLGIHTNKDVVKAGAVFITVLTTIAGGAALIISLKK
jgi:hypothetical protein